MGLLVIYLLTGWLPTLMKDAGLWITAAANVTAMFQIGGTIGAVLVGWVMDKSRPAFVIAAAYAAAAVCILILSWFGAMSTALALLVFAAGFCMSGALAGFERLRASLLSDDRTRDRRELDARDRPLRQHQRLAGRRGVARDRLGLRPDPRHPRHSGRLRRGRRGLHPACLRGERGRSAAS